jgi:hypothetical protein
MCFNKETSIIVLFLAWDVYLQYMGRKNNSLLDLKS